MTTETTRHTPDWRTRGTVPRRSNFDRYSYRIVEEHRGDPIPPGMLDRYSVVARVQGESQQEADTRARLIEAAPKMAELLRYYWIPSETVWHEQRRALLRRIEGE